MKNNTYSKNIIKRIFWIILFVFSFLMFIELSRLKSWEDFFNNFTSIAVQSAMATGVLLIVPLGAAFFMFLFLLFFSLFNVKNFKIISNFLSKHSKTINAAMRFNIIAKYIISLLMVLSILGALIFYFVIEPRINIPDSIKENECIQSNGSPCYID